MMREHDGPLMSFFDEILATPPARSLAEFASVAAPLHLLDAVGRALRLAREHGVSAVFALDWRDAYGDIQHGEWSRDPSGQVLVRLNANQDSETCFRTVLHEIQHAADARDPARRNQTRLESELRAIAFVAQCLGQR